VNLFTMYNKTCIGGLRNLFLDIPSGHIKKIQEKFPTHNGGYIFVVLKKVL
jgi:hypothetical protein